MINRRIVPIGPEVEFGDRSRPAPRSARPAGADVTFIS